jgi:hypothetical protein
MAKRRQGGENEVSLFPFLSILACLIGALVLMIVVLVIAQAGKADGRTAEEIRMAQDFIRMKKEIEDREKLDALLKEKMALLEKLEQESTTKEQQLARIRNLLNQSKDIQEQNKAMSQKLAKELDDLIGEITGLRKQITESRKEIEALLAEIKKRQLPDTKAPPVLVRPPGRPLPDGTKVYFVEASGSSLRLIDAWGKDYTFSAKEEVVRTDATYRHFLTEVAKNKEARIIYLTRGDGAAATDAGMGHAQNDYGIRAAQIAVPGQGELQLDFPERLRGTLPPPPANP